MPVSHNFFLIHLCRGIYSNITKMFDKKIETEVEF